jgi:hypothetical protein
VSDLFDQLGKEAIGAPPAIRPNIRPRFAPDPLPEITEDIETVSMHRPLPSGFWSDLQPNPKTEPPPHTANNSRPQIHQQIPPSERPRPEAPAANTPGPSRITSEEVSIERQQRRAEQPPPKRVPVDHVHALEAGASPKDMPHAAPGHRAPVEPLVTPRTVRAQHLPSRAVPAAPPPLPHGQRVSKYDPAPEPEIHIHIGRLEVQAITPPSPAKLTAPSGPKPRRSLDEDLERTTGRRP